MGWVKDAKAASIAKEAARAVEEGRRVFVARINASTGDTGWAGSMSGFAEQIEAVEDAGWVLGEMSCTHDSKDRPEGYFLFRRRAA